MTFAKRYLIPRLIQYVLVIWVGITIVFLIPRFTPNDPVIKMIDQMMARGSTLEPGAMDDIIEDLTEIRSMEDRVKRAERLDFAAWGGFLGWAVAINQESVERLEVNARQEVSDSSDFMVIDEKLANIDYKLAPCCNPIHGDAIFGFVHYR